MENKIQIGQTYTVTHGKRSFQFSVTNGWQCQHDTPEQMIAWQYNITFGTFTVSPSYRRKNEAI